MNDEALREVIGKLRQVRAAADCRRAELDVLGAAVSDAAWAWPEGHKMPPALRRAVGLYGAVKR